MDDVLDRLKEGIRRFRTEVYPERAETYRQATIEPQQPHTLIVTCADSRIDPELITQAGPGEMFVTRNVGNLVPAYGEMLGGVSAVIEYAVSALKVQHVAVCGHTDCGAMKALLKPDSMDTLPTVKRWLRNAEAALSVARSLDEIDGEETDPAALLKSLTEQNVLLQIQHLRTHPSVAGAIARDELTVSGWVYDIAHGDVSIYDEATRKFTPVALPNREEGEVG